MLINDRRGGRIRSGGEEKRGKKEEGKKNEMAREVAGRAKRLNEAAVGRPRRVPL